MSPPGRHGNARRGRHVFRFEPSPAPPPRLLFVSNVGSLPTLQMRSRRTRLSEISTNFHCSIVGTCLTTAEVRQILIKLETPGAETASEHLIHTQGVCLAAEKSGIGVKLLNKTLDRKHHAMITRFAAATTSDQVWAQWSQCMRDGDIPGGYWAALTHPAAIDEIIRKVFEDVHMLSHLVGAANQVDLRRLRELEGQNAELTAKVTRQQAQLRDAGIVRERLMQELQNLGSATARGYAGDRETAPAAQRENGAVFYQERLFRLQRRSERLERDLARLSAELRDERKRRLALEEHEAVLERELAALEASIESVGAPNSQPAAAELDRFTFLYVGGRTHHLPRLRAVTETMGARWLQHDGGLECRQQLLSPLIGRADLVLFPVDCVSHDAVGTIKRMCRQLGKPYQALRSSGLASYLAAITNHGAPERNARRHVVDTVPAAP